VLTGKKQGAEVDGSSLGQRNGNKKFTGPERPPKQKVRGGRGDSPPCASPRRWLPGGSLLLCCTCAPTRERRENERTKEHRPPSSAPRSVRSLGDVRGEEGGGKAGSGREERHEERAGEKEEARQGAARSRWGAPSCRAGFGVSASFIVGFVRVVIVGQEWLRQVQQSSRTRGTDSIGDAICLMVLQLLSCSVRISSRVTSEK